MDYILHLAAGSHVDRSIDYPMEFVMDNVVGTCNILDFARSLDHLERFLYFSTDEVFKNALLMVSSMKRMIDIILQIHIVLPRKLEKSYSCLREYISTTSLYNSHYECICERQHPEKYIPMCIRRIRDARKSLSIVTVRELCLVRDTIYTPVMLRVLYCFYLITKISLRKHGAMQNALSLIS